MARATIDYGIDLGTTNSVIARLAGMDREIIKNNEQGDCTPSAVWIDKKDRLTVGRVAKERLGSQRDQQDVAFEFKKRMGTERAFEFHHSGRQMKPEELSAEVLKVLRQSAERQGGEILRSAIITVPAAFTLPQNDATKRAATLAGFSQCLLLQEPVAAALAYGFQSESDREYWLVYDLGGGTFDVALMNMRDGMFHVVNHLGDNDLGGGDIDLAIVDQVLVPAVREQYGLDDFRRGNGNWAAVFGKLKLHAEQAKIRLSTQDSVTIEIENLIPGEDEFEYDLERSVVEELAEPIVRRTIDLCKEVLAQKQLGPANITKVLLVGGVTLMPYLRQRLEDAQTGLGIPLVSDRDPMTVVAEGAAIFAGTQRLDVPLEEEADQEAFTINLDYKPLDSDPEPMVGGQVASAGGDDLSGYTIEFANVSVSPQWRSGKTGISPDGKFFAQLYAEKGMENVFEITLTDAQGNTLKTTPDRLSYRIGVTFSEIPLTHSMGIALANGEMAHFFNKGTPLSCRKQRILRTATSLRRGEAGDILCIPLMEGESLRSNRNDLIGKLEVGVSALRFDVPAGSEVEVTVAIDQSRLVTMKAYVPILDEWFEQEINYSGYKENVLSEDELRKELEAEKERLEKLRQQVEETDDPTAQQLLQDIYARRMVHEVEVALGDAAQNRDVAARCESRLRELRIGLDRIEDALEWPALVVRAEKEIDVEEGIASDSQYDTTHEERRAIDALIGDIRRAIAARNPDVLRQKVNELDALGLGIVLRHPGWWVAQVEHLENKRHTMSDQSTAETCFNSARQAIRADDLEGLKSAVRQLWRLLPEGDPDRNKVGSSVIL